MTKKDNCSLAYEYYGFKQYSKALESLSRCYKDVRKLSKKIKSDEKLFADLISHQISLGILESNIYIEMNQYAKAQSALSKTKKLIDTHIGNREIAEGLRGRVAFIMGMIAFKKEDVATGMNLLDKSKQHFLQSNNPTLAIDPLLRLAENSRLLKNVEPAERYYSELEKIGKKVKDKKRKNAVIGQALLGKAKLATNPKQSEKQYAKSLRLFTKAKHIPGVLQAKMGLASILLDNDKLNEGEELLSTVLTTAQEEQIDYIVSEVYYSLGMISLRKGNLEEGRSRVLLGLENKSQEGDTVSAANALLELANLNLLMINNTEKLQEAQQLAEKSLEIYSLLQNVPGMAHAHKTLGSVLLALTQYESAFHHLQTARNLFKKAGQKVEEARILLQLADIRREENNLQEVKSFIERAAKISENTEYNPTLQSELYQRQAAFYSAIVHSPNKGLVNELLRDLQADSVTEINIRAHEAISKLRQIYEHEFASLPQQSQLLQQLNVLEQELQLPPKSL